MISHKSIWLILNHLNTLSMIPSIIIPSIMGSGMISPDFDDWSSVGDTSEEGSCMSRCSQRCGPEVPKRWRLLTIHPGFPTKTTFPCWGRLRFKTEEGVPTHPGRPQKKTASLKDTSRKSSSSSRWNSDQGPLSGFPQLSPIPTRPTSWGGRGWTKASQPPTHWPRPPQGDKPSNHPSPMGGGWRWLECHRAAVFFLKNGFRNQIPISKGGGV